VGEQTRARRPPAAPEHALEPAEVDAGYVLTCQTIPLSDAVTVDFDA
jgi:ferredoxin